MKDRLGMIGRRMETKLFIVFLFLLVLPIGVLGYVSGARYSATIERNTIEYVSQLSDKMMGKLDDYITDLEKISVIPFYLNEIREGLKESNRFHEAADTPGNAGPPGEGGVLPEADLRRLDIQHQVNSTIYFLNNIKTDTNTVYLFDQYGTPYTVIKSGSIREDLNEVYQNWKQLASAARGLPILVSTRRVETLPQENRYVFTVVRDILDSYEPIGMIAIDANIRAIENIVKDLDSTTRGTTLIVDDSGQVIFDSEKKYLGQGMPERDLLARASASEGSFRTELNGEEMLVIYKRSAKTGWKMLITVPSEHLMADAARTRTFTIISASAIVSFALLISLVLIFALTRPLRSLVRLMKEVQSGNLNVEFPVRRPDEAGQVGRAFNRMLGRIQSLIQDIYEIEQRKKEAQLEALQHQINPHFIYNTLESIRMTAVINDDPEVGDMAQLLGKLLRYSIDSVTETVPYRKECEHLQIYVQLLNYRYGNRFKLELPVDGPDPNLPVMKLLFQPIVENAIYHGLEEQAEMRIRLSYRRTETAHAFVLEDDGAGMSEAALRELRDKLERGLPPSGKGIGLSNVHERLKLRYGAAYGLKIDSAEGKGTRVMIHLPLRENGLLLEQRSRFENIPLSEKGGA